MAKYIKTYLQINESIGKGSVILIKGKSEANKKKLYATHVSGHIALSQGGIMLFLSSEFYRIKEEEGKLKAIKIDYKNEESLKSALNLKSPGKISIVKNNNKTPFHWKTLKHTSIHSALKEIEGEIIGEAYLFESTDSESLEREKMWNEFSNIIVPRVINTAFFGEKEIRVVEYRIDGDSVDDLLNGAEGEELSIDWSIDFTIMINSPEFKKYSDYFYFRKKYLDVSFFFKSNVKLQISHDPGDYWTPPYTESEIESSNTELEEIFIEGGSVDLDSFEPLIQKLEFIFWKNQMLPDEVNVLILNNFKGQHIIKKEN